MDDLDQGQNEQTESEEDKMELELCEENEQGKKRLSCHTKWNFLAFNFEKPCLWLSLHVVDGAK